MTSEQRTIRVLVLYPEVMDVYADRGNRVRIARFLTRSSADATCAAFEARGHKQTYWVESEREPEVRSPDITQR